jgi:hypothetical protein
MRKLKTGIIKCRKCGKMFLPTANTPTLEVYLGEAEDKITYCSMKCMEETLDAVNSTNTLMDIPIKLVYFEKLVQLLSTDSPTYRAVYQDDFKVEFLPEEVR